MYQELLFPGGTGSVREDRPSPPLHDAFSSVGDKHTPTNPIMSQPDAIVRGTGYSESTRGRQHPQLGALGTRQAMREG